MSRAIVQRDWKRGLVAVTPDQDQPKGSLQRVSNMLYTRRGGLRTCDGSLIISLLNGALVTNTGPWTELFLFQPNNVNRYYIGVKKDPNTPLGTPANVVAADGGAGGSLAAGTYQYNITGLDGVGGETLMGNSNNQTIVINHLINVTWNVLANAISYNVYRGGHFMTNVATNSFTDNGSITPAGALTTISVDTTQQTLFYRIPATSYATGNILAKFAADSIPVLDGTPGGGGGSGGPGGGTPPNPASGAPPTASGGTVGNTSPLPQIVQFANKAFLALGNGFAPQIFTDPSTVVAITNTFTATYPDWQTATLYAIGDIIKPSANNAGNFIFKAVQGGTSGGAAPTFPQTQNQQVADNKIIWQNIGLGTSVPAPRGAAHVVVYAGSLWVLNTNPTTTTDNLDGPSALRMSDLNNPTSWNPLNTAFLDRDDGDQGTGIAAMTIAESGIPPTGSLVAFKNFKTFQINGVFGSSNFSIQRAQTDMGCIAPRTIEFCPGFGLIRLSHLGFSLFDTTRDKVISDDIRPFLFNDPNITDIQSLDWNFAYFAKAAQVANPPMYVAAIPVRLNGLTNVSIVSVAGNASATNSNDFVRVTRFTLVNGISTETDITSEVNILTVVGVNSIKVSTATLDTVAVKYRIYCGNVASNNYTNFQEFTPQQMVTGFTFNHPSDLSTAGFLTVGVGGLTRLCCYDLVLKAWAIIDLPFAISVLRQVRAPGTTPITIIGGFSDGSVRRIQAGDTTFDGAPVNWSFRPAEILGGGGGSRVFYERVMLRGLGNPASIQILPAYNGTNDVSQTPNNYTFGANQFHSMLDLLQTALNAHVGVSGTGVVEIDALEWEVAQLPAGSPMQFA